jgi:hypothetical protein
MDNDVSELCADEPKDDPRTYRPRLPDFPLNEGERVNGAAGAVQGESWMRKVRMRVTSSAV